MGKAETNQNSSYFLQQTGQRRVIPHTIAELDPSPPKEQLTDWSKDKVSEWLSSKKMM